jgi:hypothetical protein
MALVEPVGGIQRGVEDAIVVIDVAYVIQAAQ